MSEKHGEKSRNKTLLRKGDQVVVIAGRDKGKRGKILQVVDDGHAFLVEKVNVVKRHTRPSRDMAGGIVEKESPIHVSNVQYFDSSARKATRIGVKILEDGRKVRVAKASGEVIDQ